MIFEQTMNDFKEMPQHICDSCGDNSYTSESIEKEKYQICNSCWHAWKKDKCSLSPDIDTNRAARMEVS